MTDKEIFKAELDRLKEETSIGLSEWENGVEHGRMESIDALYKIIDSMQEEPINNKLGGINNALSQDTLAMKSAAESLGISQEDHDKIIDECLWGKEVSASEDLEEAAKHYLYSNILYDDVYVGNPTDEDCIEMFKAGANWQKQQMIKEAVDGKIYETQVRSKRKATTTGYVSNLDYNIDDKVKLIIIKED